jgi:hypothetical protein
MSISVIDVMVESFVFVYIDGLNQVALSSVVLATAAVLQAAG